LGSGTIDDPKWQLEMWEEYSYNKNRSIDRTFDFRKFTGYTNTRTADEMVREYDSRDDVHTRDDASAHDFTTLDIETLRHNIMRSYIEVSEWLGDGATQYGSHNGFVSRKMSMAWLFCAIRALINWKLANQDIWAEVDIHPLSEDNRERFLMNGECSDRGRQCGSDGATEYTDEIDLDQTSGRCAT